MTPSSRDGAVLVLGASRGIGRAVALASAKIGFPIGVGCRKLADGEAVVREITELGGRARTVVTDVTDHDSVVAAVVATHGFGPGLAGVVNNAGVIAPLAGIADADPDAWARAVKVNLIGAFHGIRAALPMLVPGGVIVNLSSAAAHFPIPGWSAYCASKAGLAMLTRATVTEHGKKVRVYGVQPGMVDTDMQAEIRASGIDVASRMPLEQLTCAEIPARAIAWLLRYAPPDLSGCEIDIEAPEIQRRMEADFSAETA